METKNSRRKFFQLFNKLFPFLAIAFIVSVFFWKFFLRGEIPIPGDFVIGTYYPWLDYKWGYEVGVPVKNPITTDVVSFSYPMRMLGLDLLKSHQNPLWNPYILAGTPLMANFQSAPYIFTNIVYLFFDNLNGWAWQVILQHFFAATFMYILLRSWKRSVLTSIAGGIVFAFSGFNLIWSQWNSHTLAASFIPLLIYAEDRFLVTFEKKYLVLFSLGLAFQVFCGYPQLTLYTLLALVLLWLTRIRHTRKKLAKTIYLTVFGFVGFGLAMIQILPGAELLAQSQRSVELNPYHWAFLPVEKIITFVAPDFFGNHATGNYWGPQDYTSNVGFIGVCAMVLSGIAIFGRKKTRPMYFVMLLAVVTLVFSLSTPISRWIWDSGFLGLKAASAHRGLVLWNFSVAVMCAYGMDYMIKNKLSLKSYAGFAVVATALFGYAAYSFRMFELTMSDGKYMLALGMNKYEVGVRNLIFPAIVLVLAFALALIIHKLPSLRKTASYLLFVLICAELFRFGWKYTPFTNKNIVYPNTPVIDYLQSLEKPVRISGVKVIPMNMRMAYGLESPEGYDAVYPQRIAQFLASMGSSNSSATTAGRYGFVDNEESHLIDLMNTKYLLAHKVDDKGKPDKNGKVLESYLVNNEVSFESGSVAVLKNKDALERAFMVYQWEAIHDDKKILDTLLDKDFPINNKIVVEDQVPISQNSNLVKNEVKYLDYKETRSKVDVKTEKDGLLFISDTYYPGWKAYVDGNEQKILRANYAFRAVVVPSGNHIVEFRYEPDSFNIGRTISILSFYFLLLYTYTIKRFQDEKK